jgi:thiol:disulfide interchange protein DsbD
MRILSLFLFTLWASFNSQAQILDPVDVDFSVKELENNKAQLIATVTLDEGWHVYSITTPDTSFIIGTQFDLEPNPNYSKAGKLQEPKPHTEYDPNFKETLSYHSNTVKFTQTITKKSTKDFEVKALFVYQTCNDETCLPPEYIDQVFKVKGATQVTELPLEPKEESAAKEGQTSNTDKTDSSESSLPSETLEIDYANTKDTGQKDSASIAQNEQYTANSDQPGRSLITIFILSFLGGFAALLTPCVFPMIPLTVSFFTKQSKNRAKGIANALIYGGAIIILYTGIGFLITIIFGSSALNALSTNPWINIFFFVLLVVFAISFFGAFEITLPSSWVNKTDQASDKGGILGIFFMALTLALVSFSCTGPIIGGLLAEAASGGVAGPIIGMFGFSLALALPFTLFAIFPGWLNSLPKSGGWLNSVKVVLGFLELAFAFKFLSNADLVWNSGILLREHFLAIWIAIFLLITFYLLGTFRMPHDSKVEKISVFRLILAVGSLWFVIYLLPGLWGAPLKLISGFPPPDFYSESPSGVGAKNIITTNDSENNEIPQGAHPDECPLQLNCFKDFEEGRAYAIKVGKPILLDFTGKACVNCRRMEENVWRDPKVLSILRNEVVLISLYVDLRKELPKDEQFVSDFTGKKVETVGEKWSEFQVRHYNSNSQPQYIMLNHTSMQPLNGSTAYDPNVQLYVDWLQEGIALFEKGV